MSISVLPPLPSGAQDSARRAREACRRVLRRPIAAAAFLACSVWDPSASGCVPPKPILGILQGLPEVSDMQTHTGWMNGCWRSLPTIIPRVLLAVLKCYRSSCQRLRSGLQGWPRPQEYPHPPCFSDIVVLLLFVLQGTFRKARVHPKVKFPSLASP